MQRAVAAAAAAGARPAAVVPGAPAAVAAGAASAAVASLRRFSASPFTSSFLTSQQLVSQKFINQFIPGYLRRLRRLRGVAPTRFHGSFHRQLDRAYANPRDILRVARHYAKSATDVRPHVLLRALALLGHCFGPNSFWSTEDKQRLHRMLSFRMLMRDVYRVRRRFRTEDVPSVIYALHCLEYRSWLLLPPVLDRLERDLDRYSAPALALMGYALGHMGLTGGPGEVRFGVEGELSRDYGDLLRRIAARVAELLLSPGGARLLAPAEAAGLAFALVMADCWGACVAGVAGGPAGAPAEAPVVPILVSYACAQLTEATLAQSGWAQFYLYMTLYCADVEKPPCEIAVKKCIPLRFQQSLHLRWLEEIVLRAQPQGTETLQRQVNEVLLRLGAREALINASVGRDSDEQHCFFVGHLIPSRSLALLYDYALPLGPRRPRPTGWVALHARLMARFGLHAAIVHKAVWDALAPLEQEQCIARMLGRAAAVAAPESRKTPRVRHAAESEPEEKEGERKKGLPWRSFAYRREKHTTEYVLS